MCKQQKRREVSSPNDLFNGLPDDVDAIPQLRLGHDQRWCKSDDVTMSRLGQKSPFGQFQAHFPSIEFRRDDDSIEEPLSSHTLHH